MNDQLLSILEKKVKEGFRIETLEIPHLTDAKGEPVKVTIKALNAEQRMRCGAMLVDDDGKADMQRIGPAMVWATVYGLNYGDETYEAVNSDADLVQLIGPKVMQMSGLRGDADELKADNEAKKKS